MVSRYYNPFQTQELRYPKQFHDDVLIYTQTRSEGGQPSDPNMSPFPRYVDMWFLAVCLGAQTGKRATITRENSHKFIEGSIFQSDPWRVELLELLAVGFTGDPRVIADPRQVIQLANELAAMGMPEVIEMLKSGQGQPVWNLSDQLLDLIQAPPQGPREEDTGKETVPDFVGLPVQELLRRGEGKHLEFKSSMRHDAKTGGANKALQKVVAKSIAAFLNTGGGTLLVGVNDAAEVVGIEKDIATLGSKASRDGWELHLRNVLREYLPAEVGPLVDVAFDQLDGRTVGVIHCQASYRPIFLTDGKEVTFFVRSGNSSQPLDVRATSEYIRGHWKPSADAD